MFLLAWDDVQNGRILEQTKFAVVLHGDFTHGSCNFAWDYMRGCFNCASLSNVVTSQQF